MSDAGRSQLVAWLSIPLCLFTLCEVNYPRLQPESALAVFVMFGLVICYLVFPTGARRKSDEVSVPTEPATEAAPTASNGWYLDLGLMALAIISCGFVVLQTEPLFEFCWLDGVSLGNRAGRMTVTDSFIGILGLIAVIDAARRSIGWIVPGLAMLFVVHSFYNYGSFHYGWPALPDWLLAHRGQSLEDISATTFLQSLGVFGPAVSVMFRYVFLFVIFGSLLEMSGATQFIIDFSRKLFSGSTGGPAKVSVLSSALMGSLSGSAVANAVTTGAFTIPLMKSSGFKSHEAAAVEAAAGSGGALVPPVMGAAAYMMLELVPGVTLPQIIRAALIPALLYYLSLFLIVHFHAARIGSTRESLPVDTSLKLVPIEGATFFGSLTVLITLLFFVSPFKAISGAIVIVVLMSLFRRREEVLTWLRWLALVLFLGVVAGYLTYLDAVQQHFRVLSTGKVLSSIIDASTLGLFVCLLPIGFGHPFWRKQLMGALDRASRNGVALIAAAACVGIIIGIIQKDGLAGPFSRAIRDLVETSLPLALVGIMISSLVLGMGVPSVVCYLLIATLMGPLLVQLGAELSVTPLAAHLFIFYFGMMSMVTPPVALAAYAAGSIANADVMRTAITAFRFSLAGFTLPFMFIYRPALLLSAPVGTELQWYNVALAIVMSSLGILALAAGIAGYFRSLLPTQHRVLAFVSSALLLSPHLGGRQIGFFVNLAGVALLILVWWLNRPATTTPLPEVAV